MYSRFLHKNSQRGFYLIGLLIVLLIIAILYGKQLLPDKAGPGMVTRIDQSRGTACMVNRSTVATNLTSWQISHSNEVPTVEKLREGGMSIPACPDGGTIEIIQEGDVYTVYCSKHYPKPTPSPGAVAAPIFPGQPAPFPPQPVAPASAEQAMPPAE